MEIKIIQDLEKKYELELENVIGEIKKAGAKLVLLQFPDGLKPYATSVVDFLRKKTNAEFLVWFGSCYGACDVPILGKDLEGSRTKSLASSSKNRERKKIDLVIQFGHNEVMSDY